MSPGRDGEGVERRVVCVAVGSQVVLDDADDEDFVSPLGIYLKDKIGVLSDINITDTLECVLLL